MTQSLLIGKIAHTKQKLKMSQANHNVKVDIPTNKKSFH